jgi:exopolysaccharide biosynthesis polyprenyl glycosylphosphotransferase
VQSRTPLKSVIGSSQAAAEAGHAPATAQEPLALIEGTGRDIRARRPYLVRLLLRQDSYRRLARIAMLLTIDLVGVWAAAWTALAVKDVLKESGLSVAQVSAGAADYVPFAFLVTALLFARAGLYGPREARPGLVRVIATLFQVVVIALVFALVSGSRFSTYWIFYGGLLFACIYIGGLRHSFDALTGRMLTAFGYRRRAALIGSGPRVAAVAEALGDHAGQRYEPVGYFSTNGDSAGGLRDLGDLDHLPAKISTEAIEEVVIADPDFPQDRAVELISDCHAQGVRVRVAASTIEILTQRAELVPGDGLPLLEVKPPVFEGFEFALKRSFDFVGAAVLLLLSSPVLAVTAALVKLTSPGPVLHRSLRPGIGGEPFRCFKFRTMYEDAEARQSEFEHLNEMSGAIFKLRGDPRVTRVGRFLRRNSLDELPQLFNVLRGEMSLVGPRPLPLRDHSRLDDWHRRRYLILPGITGLWQVSGRSDLDFDDMVRLDFLYLERWSILLDLTILLKTVPAVLRRRGAY